MTTATMTRYSVTLESNDRGSTEPVDSTEVEAANAREACKVAARHWGLAPHQWCFEQSPCVIVASEMRGIE